MMSVGEGPSIVEEFLTPPSLLEMVGKPAGIGGGGKGTTVARVPEKLPVRPPRVVSGGGGAMKEVLNTEGLGLSLEIAYPKFVTKGLTNYTGVGIDAGILRDKKGLGFYATTKTATKSGVAFSAQVESFIVSSKNSNYLSTNIDRTYLVGRGYEVGLGVGPIGGNYSVSNAADYGRISTYQMTTISIGFGIDIGFVNWNTHTYITGGH